MNRPPKYPLKHRLVETVITTVLVGLVVIAFGTALAHTLLPHGHGQPANTSRRP